MGILFRIDAAARLVEYVIEGDATAEEARAFLDAVLDHPEFCRGFNFLGDRRGVGRAPGTRYVQSVAAQVNERCKALAPCRWAVVVSDELADGMARMWGQLTGFSGVTIQAFPTAEEAADWLGITPTKPPPPCLSAEPVPNNSTVDLRLPSRVEPPDTT
jgi:hypothetical protein